MTPLRATISFLKLGAQMSALAPQKDGALVLGFVSGNGKSGLSKLAGAQKELAASAQFLLTVDPEIGKAGKLLPLMHHSQSFEEAPKYCHLFGFGAGTPADCHPQNILSWGGRLGRALRERNIVNADVLLDSLYNPAASSKAKEAPKDFANRPLRSDIPSFEDFIEKFALGIYLGLYTYDRYKTLDKDKKANASKQLNIRFLAKNMDAAKVNKILKKAEILAESVCHTRDLQNVPANDLVPADLARMAQEAGKRAGFRTTVFDEKKLATEGMGGILAVGKGSDSPPRLIIMEYNANKTKMPTVVLIGKGITFDTGGYSLKPPAGMEGMKYDMSGAASVIGAMMALARLDAPVHVIGMIATAENMVNGKAQRPGDIYTAHNGRTVEVLNTDAEGRLVLGDALSYAKQFKPDAVIDIATLTGAVGIALGSPATGLMGNNGALIDAFHTASANAGEKTWELPLFREYQEEMMSKIADYKNISTTKTAGSSMGGIFLNFFVDNAYPWVHLDVASTADTPSGQGDHCPPENAGTGVPVRSLVEFTMNFKDYFKV